MRDLFELHTQASSDEYGQVCGFGLVTQAGDLGIANAQRPGERSVGGLGFGVALGGELEDRG